MRRWQTYLRIPGLLGFEIKGRVINDGAQKKRDRAVSQCIEPDTRSKRGTVRIVVEVSEIVGRNWRHARLRRIFLKTP